MVDLTDLKTEVGDLHLIAHAKDAAYRIIREQYFRGRLSEGELGLYYIKRMKAIQELHACYVELKHWIAYNEEQSKPLPKSPMEDLLELARNDRS